MAKKQVTLLVHGTFANPGYDDPDYEPGDGDALPTWWRISEGGAEGNTADVLQAALTAIDPELAGTVWRPGADKRDEGLDYHEVTEWTGDNTDKARVRAAKELAGSLDQLAERRGASAEDPLAVNLVAHSHGGNVVLEAFKHFTDRVRPRQVCMLGTPLVWRFTDPRIFYLGYLIALLVAASIGFWEGFLEPDPLDPDDLTGFPLFVAALITFLALLPLLLWSGVLVLTVVRWISRIFPGRPAYGPDPSDLELGLGGRPIQLFISPEDEADLMLQLGVAPVEAYKAMVRGQPKFENANSSLLKAVGFLLRLVEFAYLRPFSYVIGAPFIEIFLERFGLGFPFRSVLVRNYEMVTWTGTDTYQPAQVVTNKVEPEDADARALRLNLSAGGSLRSLEHHDHLAHDPDRIEALRHTLQDAFKGVKRQVRLRHSGYYESPAIISKVAEAIAAE